MKKLHIFFSEQMSTCYFHLLQRAGGAENQYKWCMEDGLGEIKFEVQGSAA